MHQPRSASFMLPALAALALLVTGCSGGEEQSLLQKYFNAAKLRDSGTLSNIATVRFDPDKDGVVQSFSVTSVGEEQKRSIQLRALRKAHDDAKASEDEFSKKKKEFQDANMEAIDRVLKGERANASMKGKDLEVQTAWAKWRTDMAEHAKAVNDAREQLGAEVGRVEASVFDPRKQIDVSEYDAEVSKKDVTISADVRTPAGQAAPKTMVVTLERAVLKGPSGEVNGRWVITGIREAGAAAPTS